VKPAPKLAVFAVFVLGAYGLAAVVGTAVGPIDVGGETPAVLHDSPTHQDGP
jgi:hypothetical protein